MDMQKLCRTAGLNVAQPLGVDGYLTDRGGPDLLKRGFKYIESKQSDGRVIVYTEKDGSPVSKMYLQSEYQPFSRYEAFAESAGGLVPDARNIDTFRHVVKDRITGDVLGSVTVYTAHAGWFDRRTVGLFGQLFWSCPEHLFAPRPSLEEAVFTPARQEPLTR